MDCYPPFVCSLLNADAVMASQFAGYISALSPTLKGILLCGIATMTESKISILDAVNTFNAVVLYNSMQHVS